METDFEKFVVEFYAAWNSHDVHRLAAVYADDFVYEDVPVDVVMKTKKELADTASSLFTGVPDVNFEQTRTFCSGNMVCTEWIMTGTNSGNVPDMPATGQKIFIRGASIIEVKGDKVVRQSDYYHSERKK